MAKGANTLPPLPPEPCLMKLCGFLGRHVPGLLELFICGRRYVCMCVYVCVRPQGY